MKAKRSTPRLQVPAQQNPTNTKKPRSTSRRTAAQADEDPDAAVLIDPLYLVEHHGMSKNVATRIAKGALDICSKRWKRAEVRLSNDEIDYSHAFIHIGYTSKVPSHDVDMEAWGAHGAWLKREIHDYLLIRACEEVRVRPPTFASSKAPDPIQEFPTLWKSTEVPEAYHHLAAEAAWHAALLAGVRKFDRAATGMSLSMAKRTVFRRLFSKTLREFVDRIPELKIGHKDLVFELETKLGTGITRATDNLKEIEIRGFAQSAFFDAVVAFALAYVAALNPG